MPLKITFTNNEIADFLRVDPTQETNTITTMTNAAMQEAEGFLNTDFSTWGVDELGATVFEPVEAPAMVKDWVLNRVAQKFENRGTAVKPDYAALKQFRVINFSAPRNLNRVASETPETDAINGVT